MGNTISMSKCKLGCGKHCIHKKTKILLKWADFQICLKYPKIWSKWSMEIPVGSTDLPWDRWGCRCYRSWQHPGRPAGCTDLTLECCALTERSCPPSERNKSTYQKLWAKSLCFSSASNSSYHGFLWAWVSPPPLLKFRSTLVINYLPLSAGYLTTPFF